MAAILPVVSVLSLVATAVGTGVAFMAQRQQAAQAEAMARYNYDLATQQAQMQAALAAQQAAANASLLSAQAAAQQHNAAALSAQANAVERNYSTASETNKRIAQVNADRERDNARRFLALQTAKVGKSGVLLAGTPLDSLADAANVLELKAQDIFFQGELESRKMTEVGDIEGYRLRGAASNEAMNASMTLFQAAQERWSGAVAQQKLKLDLYGAEIDRLDAMGTAQGYRMASYGTLFSGLSNLGSAAYDMQRYGTFTAA